MSRINVNAGNSKVIDGRLFITGIKMSRLGVKLAQDLVQGSTIHHPTLGVMYEFAGNYSRS
jgi:hypothetical protein